MLPIQHPPASNSQQLPNPSLINSANGSQNFQPQNQFPFFNPNTQMGNMGSSMFQQPGFMNLPNNHFVPPVQMGSVSGFPAQGSFNQMNPCLPLPQCFAQNIPNLVQQLNQNMGLVNGQFCLPFQNMNQHVPMNMSQVSHNSFGGSNQSLPMVLQNQPFGANQGFYPVNQNPQNFIPQTMGGNGSGPLMGQNSQNFIPQTMGGNCPRPLMGPAQQLPGNSTMPYNSMNQLQQAWNLQSPAFTGSQGKSSINDGGNRPPPRNITKNTRKGFQKNQNHHMKNEKKKFGSPYEQKGKGFHNERRNKSGVTSSTDLQKRIFSLVYTEREIKLWRETRQRNYPSSANIQKRLANKRTDCTVVDKEALRQELSEVLAKQAELGVEVAEIPSEYRSYSENCDLKKHGRRDTRKEAGRQNSYGDRLNKRKRRDKRNRPKKKAKFEKQSSNTSSLNEREPTLLQKLLKADIKRDNSQLLQALRFTVMNSFFKEWPNKPLMFPSEIVEENGCETNLVDKKSTMVQKLCHDDDNAISTGDRNDYSYRDNDDDHSNNDNDDDHSNNDNDDDHSNNDNDDDHSDNDNDEDDDHIDNDADKFEGDRIPIAEEEEGEIID